jgi:hypothetical protein
MKFKTAASIAALAFASVLGLEQDHSASPAVRVAGLVQLACFIRRTQGLPSRADAAGRVDGSRFGTFWNALAVADRGLGRRHGRVGQGPLAARRPVSSASSRACG